MASEAILETFDWLRANGFMKGSTMTLDEATDLYRGFDHGNFGNAYESTDWDAWSARALDGKSNAFAWGAILGFYSSYELDEIDEDNRGTVAYLRTKHPEYA